MAMPKPKSVYVAASYEQREDVQSFYKRLKEHGHTITADWTTHKEIASLPTEQEQEELSRRYVIEDTNGVASAQIFILLLGERKSTGAHIELGIALGSKNVQQILLVASHLDSQLFYRHPKIKQVKNTDEAILAIESVQD